MKLVHKLYFSNRTKLHEYCLFKVQLDYQAKSYLKVAFKLNFLSKVSAVITGENCAAGVCSLTYVVLNGTEPMVKIILAAFV